MGSRRAVLLCSMSCRAVLLCSMSCRAVLLCSMSCRAAATRHEPSLQTCLGGRAQRSLACFDCPVLPPLRFNIAQYQTHACNPPPPTHPPTPAETTADMLLGLLGQLLENQMPSLRDVVYCRQAIIRRTEIYAPIALGQHIRNAKLDVSAVRAGRAHMRTQAKAFQQHGLLLGIRCYLPQPR